MVGIARAFGTNGYFKVGMTGRVYRFGSAVHYGDMSHVIRNRPVVGMTATPNGLGYWLLHSDGTVSAFGNASSGCN